MSITAEVIILFIVVLVGALCKKLNYFTNETIHGTTQIVVNVTLPCLTISNMQRPFATDVLVNFLLTLVLSSAVILVSLAATRFLFRKRDAARRAVLVNMEAFSNCGFMGYPIILAINPDWMMYAVAYNIAFTFISWTIGVSLYGNGSRMNLRRALLNPNVFSAFIGFTLFCCNVTLPAIPAEALALIGGVTTPLSMLLIGTRVCRRAHRRLQRPRLPHRRALRLVIIPLIAYAALRPFPWRPPWPAPYSSSLRCPRAP